jgi:thiamine pyrophosphokinase
MIKCEVVILANGDFPTHAVPLSLLENAKHIVACDGAIANLVEHHVHHQDVVVVGDGDSVPDALRDRLIQIDEQEDNDLTKATRYCLSKGLRRIVYLGTTGKREDHTLGNISLMARYAQEMGVEPLLATDYGWFVVAKGEAAFDGFKGQQVSIFNISCKTISSEGLRWQAYGYRQFWQGTLNEVLDNRFVLKGDGYFMVYRTYQTKGRA